MYIFLKFQIYKKGGYRSIFGQRTRSTIKYGSWKYLPLPFSIYLTADFSDLTLTNNEIKIQFYIGLHIGYILVYSVEYMTLNKLFRERTKRAHASIHNRELDHFAQVST